MAFGDKLRRVFRNVGGPIHPDGVHELIVGDAAYDEWEIVEDFDDLETARAWRQQLTDAGMEAVLTSDYPVNEYGRGDISVRVPPRRAIEAQELLEPE